MPERSAEEPHDRAGRRPIDLAWASAVFLIPVILTLQPRLGTIDLAYHLRAGETILADGAIPDVDTYTFTIAGRPWVDQQWGSQAILALAHRTGGFDLLFAFRALLAGLTFWVVYLACRRRGAPPRAASVLSLLGYLVAVPTIALRPQLLALPLFAASLWALASRDERPRRVWMIPAAALLVANLHGSFVLFPLIAGLALLEDAVDRRPTTRRMALVTVLTLGATLVSPFGVEAWTYAYDLATNDVIRDTISEWEPVSLPNVIGLFTMGSMLAVVWVLATRKAAVRWIDLVWLGVFAVMALAAIRGIVWWTVVAPVTLAAMFAAPDPVARPRESRTPAIAIVGTLSIAALLFLPWLRPGDVLLDVPPGISRAVGDLPAGTRVFPHQPWASWFEFAFPDKPVFSDSRIEIYPRSIWEDYSEVAFAGAGWEDVLERWRPDAIVAEGSWDLIPYLKRDPTWEVAHEDEDGIVFVRA